jgi:ubiquinone/menaquinone biosynthesis C-methylase UbiE
MLPDIITASRDAPRTSTAPRLATAKSGEPSDSLFEDVAWLYAFCREYVFRDDTARIISALWPSGPPSPSTELIELGCGPGFYSRRLAQRFPQILVIGADRSANQLAWARTRAASLCARNCVFERVNVLELPFHDGRFEVLIASRLFTVLPNQSRAVSEIYRVLKSGGRCFIAEPRYSFWASIPLVAMWLLARSTHFRNGYCEPRKARVFSADAFRELFVMHSWKSIRTWQDGRYQYALCEKG